MRFREAAASASRCRGRRREAGTPWLRRRAGQRELFAETVRARGGAAAAQELFDDQGRSRGYYSPDNRLNDLTGREWLYWTRSVINRPYPANCQHALRRAHGGQKPPDLCADLIRVFSKRGTAGARSVHGRGRRVVGSGAGGADSGGRGDQPALDRDLPRGVPPRRDPGDGHPGGRRRHRAGADRRPLRPGTHGCPVLEHGRRTAFKGQVQAGRGARAAGARYSPG